MVLDFSDVKKKVKQLIDEEFDHKLIIPSRYEKTSIENTNRFVRCDFELLNGEKIIHTAPESAYCLLDAETVTTDDLALAIKAKLNLILPKNVEEIGLNIYPEDIQGAYYHYSHGLKQHEGNCQRIAHGHRSKIEILENGSSNETLEKYWAGLWEDIYIGTRPDLIRETSLDGQPYFIFRYQACQGEFEITLPASRCYLIDTDSTVENLAEHIASELHKLHPDKQLQVFAYEGINKGAISQTNPEPIQS
jgi:6-pyruvoyl-tetrahydropterin synthase